jgi:hypothetical protein
VDHNRVRLGDGEVVFVRASAALYAWKMFDLGWVRILPHGAPAGVGTTVAVLAQHIGFRSLNFSRVVYEVSGEEGGVRKLGFAYGTLLEHDERRGAIRRRVASGWLGLLRSLRLLPAEPSPIEVGLPLRAGLAGGDGPGRQGMIRAGMPRRRRELRLYPLRKRHGLRLRRYQGQGELLPRDCEEVAAPVPRGAD